MIREVFMPALSSTMTEGKIVSWVKSPGDKVEKGETVVIVESDKADMDVESFMKASWRPLWWTRGMRPGG
jgi:pyruvate dehydrogenase E2 component (dihydrolipoamide acetyltransferase)